MNFQKSVKETHVNRVQMRLCLYKSPEALEKKYYYFLFDLFLIKKIWKNVKKRNQLLINEAEITSIGSVLGLQLKLFLTQLLNFYHFLIYNFY